MLTEAAVAVVAAAVVVAAAAAAAAGGGRRIAKHGRAGDGARNYSRSPGGRDASRLRARRRIRAPRPRPRVAVDLWRVGGRRNRKQNIERRQRHCESAEVKKEIKQSMLGGKVRSSRTLGGCDGRGEAGIEGRRVEESGGRTCRGADGGEHGVMGRGVMMVRGREHRSRVMMGGARRRHARHGMWMGRAAVVGAGREGAPRVGIVTTGGGLAALGRRGGGGGQLKGERIPLVLVRHGR